MYELKEQSQSQPSCSGHYQATSYHKSILTSPSILKSPPKKQTSKITSRLYPETLYHLTLTYFSRLTSKFTFSTLSACPNQSTQASRPLCLSSLIHPGLWLYLKTPAHASLITMTSTDTSSFIKQKLSAGQSFLSTLAMLSRPTALPFCYFISYTYIGLFSPAQVGSSSRRQFLPLLHVPHDHEQAVIFHVLNLRKCDHRLGQSTWKPWVKWDQQ